jgi:hypothetical protein
MRDLARGCRRCRRAADLPRQSGQWLLAKPDGADHVALSMMFMFKGLGWQLIDVRLPTTDLPQIANR